MENANKSFEPHNNFHKIVIVEALCVVIILIAVLLIKYTNDTVFNEMKEFYTENFLVETDVEEVLSEDTGYED